MEQIIKTARTKFKSDVAAKIAETVTPEQVNNVALQLRAQNPELSEDAAKRKAKKLIEKSIKEQAEKLANKVVPTLSVRKKFNPKLTLEEVETQIEQVEK